MKRYQTNSPFNVPMSLLIPTEVKEYGVVRKDFSEGDMFFGSFRTFGGTENTSNDVYTLIDTAIIDTWFRPDIKANCRIKLLDTGDIYEIISEPENINMRNQYLQFKVRKYGGKP